MVIVVRCAAPSRGSSLYSRDTVISQVCPFEQLDLWHLILLSLESFTITQWWTETKNEPYLIPCTCTPPEENICKYCKRKKSIFSAPTQTPPRRSKTWEAETTFDGSTDIRSCSFSRHFSGNSIFFAGQRWYRRIPCWMSELSVIFMMSALTEALYMLWSAIIY